MIDVFIFGGTSEGRELCEACSAAGARFAYAAATGEGARAASACGCDNVFAGAMDADQMTEVLLRANPLLVIDATHPFAVSAGTNIAVACFRAKVNAVRIERKESGARGDLYFVDAKDAAAWLSQSPGIVFLTTGASKAETFAGVSGFPDRIWARVLPTVSSLSRCLALGYRVDRLVCAQGPFSVELNKETFRHAKANILVTKAAGDAGGFEQKIEAARALGMTVAVIKRPSSAAGARVAVEATFGEAVDMICEIAGRAR